MLAHEAGKTLHLLDRKEMAYIFPKVGYRPLSVQC